MPVVKTAIFKVPTKPVAVVTPVVKVWRDNVALPTTATRKPRPKETPVPS